MSLNINNLNSNFFSSMFGSSSSSNSASGLSSLLGDYASIKSGSYRKLMKAYYSSDASKTDSTESSSKKSTSLQQTKMISSDAKKLSEAAKTLYTEGKKSVFNKTEQKDADGNAVKDYDRNAIYKAVKEFADEYNSTVDSAQKSNNTSILIQTAGMVTTTQHNSKLLSEIGIKVDSDNHLTIDEDYFKKDANMDVVKSLFSGSFSYGYTIGTKAAAVQNYASMSLSSSGSAYTSDGTYSVSTNDAVSYFSTKM